MAAAVHNSARVPNPRQRSSSDPFNDPSKPQKRPPPPPPKSAAKPSVTTAPKSAPLHRDMTEAVHDAVAVRGSSDYSPRSRVGRSQTSFPTGSTRHTQPSSHRSQSEDSVLAAAAAVEKAKANGKGRPKKGSQHADVIDRLDFTGVGPMFHHDGPFDACAPSRNRQRDKAPMLAWRARDDAPAKPNEHPAANAYTDVSNRYEPPKKKVDAIAEAWGIHEPEPYEEFFAGGGSRTNDNTPASSIYNGKDSHSNSTSRSGAKRTKDGRDPRDVYKEYLDDGQAVSGRSRNNARRSILPPPQPIFVPDTAEPIDTHVGSPPGSPGGQPKRSKSLMHRIRKMRDAPNVPVGADYEDNMPSSPTGAEAVHRPTHRSQNSFLGRFSAGSRPGPSSPGADKPEPYVFIDTQNNKELPLPPRESLTSPRSENALAGGYFDGVHGGGPASASSPGLGRKTSLMKKVRGVVVRGNK